MKQLITVLFFLFISVEVFSQDEIRIELTSAKWASVKKIQDLSSDFSKTCLITSYEFSSTNQGDVKRAKIGGNQIPKNLKEHLRDDKSELVIDNINCKEAGKLPQKYKVVLKNE
ncbi:MAG: hypothetical protein AB7O73_11860 [Bacteroidia bacterium]